MAVGRRAAQAIAADTDRLRAEFAQLSAELQSGELRAGTLPTQPGSATWAFAPLMRAMRTVLAAAPTSAWPRLAISFNEDQIESKLWLLERFPALEPSGRVVILGAWFGLLAILLDRLSPGRPAHVLCVDVDDEVCATASRLLSVLPRPPAVLCADMMTLDYEALSAAGPTVFVNTSCEHLPDVAGWRDRVPPGAQVVLQSNDHRGCSEHVSCVPDLAAFERQARLSAVDYKGTLPLKHFRRFMLIGRA